MAYTHARIHTPHTRTCTAQAHTLRDAHTRKHTDMQHSEQFLLFVKHPVIIYYACCSRMESGIKFQSVSIRNNGQNVSLFILCATLLRSLDNLFTFGVTLLSFSSDDSNPRFEDFLSGFAVSSTFSSSDSLSADLSSEAFSNES